MNIFTVLPLVLLDIVFHEWSHPIECTVYLPFTDNSQRDFKNSSTDDKDKCGF